MGGSLFRRTVEPSIDFLRFFEGENYLWDGTNWSTGTNADIVFAPSVSPVQIDYYPEDLAIFPDRYRGKFYLALSGVWSKGPGKRGDRSVVMLDFSFQEDRMLSVPKHFLKYRGEGLQVIPGLGIGPDGLYFTPLFPIADGRSAVLKVQYDESNSHPYKMRNDIRAKVLLITYACEGCHSFDVNGVSTRGPILDRNSLVSRLNKRLNSAEYIESIREVDSLDIEPYKSYKEARQEVLQEKGDEKIRTWIKFHLIEPKFDNPSALMPNLGITESEALILTDLLLKKEKKSMKIFRLFRSYIPELRYRDIVFSFLIGGFLSFLFLAVLYLLYLRKR